MKRFTIAIIATLLSITLFSQGHLMWPVQGQNSGQGIIYKPQDYIDDELNFSNLFITATEGTPVFAPCDGIVQACNYSIMLSLRNSISFPCKDGTDKEIRESFAKELWDEKKINVDPKYISILIGIQTDKGIYYISGLRPVKKLKTGYAIKKGEIIGTVGYSYRSILKPGISIERSFNGKTADPMSDFGLVSTFIPPKKRKGPNLQYSAAQLKEDFAIFRKSLKDGHPGLYDYIPKATLDERFEQTYSLISKPMSASGFFDLLNRVIMNIRDSHTNLHLDEKDKSTSVYSRPTVFFGFLNDSLIITRSTEKYKEFIGKRIIEVNGVKADSLLSEANRSFVLSREGFIESQKNFYLLTLFWSYYFNLYPLNNGQEFTLTFIDGTKRNFPYKKAAECMNTVPDWSKYRLPSRTNIETQKLDRKTALLDLNTFKLTEKDKNDIIRFIKAISDSSYKNLIIDVRNNAGGDSFEELFALIAQKPFKTLVSSMVNQNDTYQFFKYCTNYSGEERQLFMGYKKEPGKDGYYLPADSCWWNYPNDSAHFGGNIYVLTNEFSISAATLFPALVHKYKRGVVVGRETGSTYYQMNASKFANVKLKNTEITLRIPLVKLVFDSVIDSTIPWGRGVVPNYPVQFTLGELAGENDVILAYTLSLIDKFEKEENAPALTSSSHKTRGYLWPLVACLFIGILGGGVWWFRKRRICE